MDRCKPIWIEHPLHRHVSGNLLALPEVISRRDEPANASEDLAAYATGVRNACATADDEPPPPGVFHRSPAPEPEPESTDLGDERGRAADEVRYLLIAGADQLISVPLPASGAVVIGRDATADVALAHPKISRRHARVIVGAELAIEDLGSTNGVFVGRARVSARAAWPIGESAKLGPFTAIVVRSRTGAPVTADGAAPAALVVRDPGAATTSALLERVARHQVNVLIQGETGAGKEVLARRLHALSGRPGELVAINCAALSPALLESELFGHEQGAFTGAERAKPGLLEITGAGTVLLDEIGDLPLGLQGKLLRALEAREVYRVGGVAPIRIAARVLAATHRALPDEVAKGRFREDLYFRLCGITLEVAPLRQRQAEIPRLAMQFLAEAARAAGATAPPMTAAATAALCRHPWPGNVRELRGVVERALLLALDRPIEVRHLGLAPRAVAAPDERSAAARFQAAVRAHRGNVSAIARAIATSRSHVRRLAARFGVDLDAARS
ncbi:MAG: sigma 54-interacting transcriptional regulator [Deltaproteobacteria bacterium]|nr:sigma 54-interacting transcriptional regulator [Deltaproteobacteria bacterium]